MSTVNISSKRADARRNIEAIVDAATRLLAKDPDASMLAIARAAGVGRVTLYGHFDSRPTLVAEVARRAIAHTDEALRAVDTGGEPRDAMARLLEATWMLTEQFGAIVVAATQTLPADAVREAHVMPAQRMRTLLARGREAGAFTTDQPLEWQLTMIQAVLHAASAAVHRGEIPSTQAPSLVVGTLLASLDRESHRRADDV